MSSENCSIIHYITERPHSARADFARQHVPAHKNRILQRGICRQSAAYIAADEIVRGGDRNGTEKSGIAVRGGPVLLAVCAGLRHGRGRGVAVQAELPTAAPAAVEDVPVVDAAAQPQLSLNCRAAILVDQDTGTVLYEKNADEQVPIASITKVMTLLLTFEAIHNGQLTLETTVPVSEHAYHMGGSQIWLEPGEQFTLDEMIKAICVSSANDAAVAVAELVGGSERPLWSA